MSGYEEAYKLMEEIYKNFSDEDKCWFVSEEPVTMHNSLGLHLRNHAKLWTHHWEPELVGGVYHSPEHPDAVSNKVITDFQNKLLKDVN